MILTVHSKTPSVIQESPKRTSTICTITTLHHAQNSFLEQSQLLDDMQIEGIRRGVVLSGEIKPVVLLTSNQHAAVQKIWQQFVLRRTPVFPITHTVWSCRVLLRPPDQSSSVTSVGIVGPHLDVNQYHTDLGLFPTDSFSIKTPFQIFFT
ncbi:hypothetical protein T4B_11518 [Trichinella pseudospiralis]|uniref:Uncharacterized protein n=1 Tax=Trichinella pseudospiralis TaxID=6337 RepID=A0A0V1K7V7_TRIPS|nr:hypothetical protein T4A_1305 [Trichinella pseudospiralis]KRZ09950.1 hypothetical protein T4B_11518 [Trichinella pseudospiralis]KRZ43029.1 hypothetical protein T4C_13396 [Trichinella pseudospiralis]